MKKFNLFRNSEVTTVRQHFVILFAVVDLHHILLGLVLRLLQRKGSTQVRVTNVVMS